MAETPVPITYGSGQASVAGDIASGVLYQQIKVVDGTLGSNTALIVNADGTANVRISGSVATAGGTFTGSVSGTVGASIIGIAPVFIVGGSIAGTFTTPNQSVSGTVGASIIGIVPVQLSNSSVITVWQNSSIIAVPTGNQSVSGAVSISNFPTSQNVSGSVVAFQGTNPWIVTGSVQGSFTPSGNQSVSGTVQTDVRGSVATVIIGGSIAASFTPPANQSVSGTVQVDVRSSVAVVIIGGSIAASFTPPANQSVSGTVNIGTGGPVSVTGTMSVLGTIPVTQATASNPWIITGSVQGSFSPAANQSVSGTVGASIIGSVPVTIAGPVPSQSVSGTVGASIIGQLPAGTAVLGSIAALQGTNPWTVVSSLAGGIFPISGSVAATIVGTPNVNTAGSVVAFQGTSPWVVNFQNSSILAVPVSSTIVVWQGSSVLAVPVGSVITVLQAPSIVGTYAEDAASASGDKGFLVMGARNDTLSSVTSSDGDYSSHVVGPAGELIAANAPFTKWVQGTASLLGGTFFGNITNVLAPPGGSIFTYVTGLQVVNASANNVFLTLLGGSSTVGFTIAPANGGSNIVFPNALKVPANGGFAASVSGVSSIYLSAQGFIAKI